MNRYYASSSFIHFVFISFLLWSPWSNRQPNFILIDGFDYLGSGGGGGGGGKIGPKGGPKQEELGQIVPEPIKAPIPKNPAPVQKEIKAAETWKIKNQKESTPVKSITKPDSLDPIERGEKSQEAQSNVVRRGKGADEKEGDGKFDFDGEGGGPGKGPGVGIGIGPGSGMGGGSGFGSYLGILRRRIWQEWTQSPVYGTRLECTVGLTIDKSGMVNQITIDKSSGDPFFDNLAKRSIRNSSPLPPLPSWFPNNNQRFRIKFVVIE